MKHIITILFLITISETSYSETKEFIKPNINGIRLNWCLSKEADCGEPVAHMWCNINGFSKAIYWNKDTNMGKQSPTSTIKNNETCFDETCDSFTSIQCYNPDTHIESNNEIYFDINSIINNKALKFFNSKYINAKLHKAFSQSESGAWASRTNQTSVEHAKKSALIKCQKLNIDHENTYPCIILNINNSWQKIKHK